MVVRAPAPFSPPSPQTHSGNMQATRRQDRRWCQLYSISTYHNIHKPTSPIPSRTLLYLPSCMLTRRKKNATDPHNPTPANRLPHAFWWGYTGAAVLNAVVVPRSPAVAVDSRSCNPRFVPGGRPLAQRPSLFASLTSNRVRRMPVLSPALCSCCVMCPESHPIARSVPPRP